MKYKGREQSSNVEDRRPAWAKNQRAPFKRDGRSYTGDSHGSTVGSYGESVAYGSEEWAREKWRKENRKKTIKSRQGGK